MNFHIVTLFPEMFDSYLGESILARAIKEKKIKVNFVNPRKFVTGKYRKVWPDGNVSLQIDERPYGGGPGMVMMAEPVVKAVESIVVSISKKSQKSLSKSQTLIPRNHLLGNIKIINFTPSGEKFTTEIAKEFTENTKNKGKKKSKGCSDIILICGRYEGIDVRMEEILIKMYGKKSFMRLSIGDYVLTGGELPAMVLIDCISRQVDGVLGNFDSREEERASSSEIYTRPEVIEWPVVKKAQKVKVKTIKYKVPPILLSGDHKKIEDWKKGK